MYIFALVTVCKYVLCLCMCVRMSICVCKYEVYVYVFVCVCACSCEYMCKHVCACVIRRLKSMYINVYAD